MSDEVVRYLKELKLNGVAQGLLEVAAHTSLAAFGSVSSIARVPPLESAEREVNGLLAK